MILKDLNRLKTQRLHHCLKVLGYCAVIFGMTAGLSWAHLEDQVEKASTLVLSKVATLIVGGATLFGGGYSLIQGDVSRGLAILGTGALTGIGIALSKNGSLFNLLQ